MATGENIYLCEYCQKHFSDNSFRRETIHLQAIPKSFLGNEMLKRHLRIHSREKLFTCELCKKAFSDKGDLKNHLTIHSGEKPYSYYQCL